MAIIARPALSPSTSPAKTLPQRTQGDQSPPKSAETHAEFRKDSRTGCRDVPRDQAHHLAHFRDRSRFSTD